MSRENVEVVRVAYEAFAHEGLDRFMEHFTDDIEYHVLGGAEDLIHGPNCGKDAVRAWLQDWIDMFDAFRIAPVELIDAEGCVVVAVMSYGGRARQSGIEIAGTYGVVFTIRDGKITRGREYATREQALEAAGLSG